MKYEFISPARIESYWQALDEIARERKYLLLLEGPEKSSTEEFIGEIIEKNWTHFIALDGERVVGWCDIVRHEREGIDHTGHVGMGVVESHRRQGIGERLIRLSIDDAFSKGIERIELEVFSSNQGAVALYEKIGFILEGRRRKARFIDGTYDDLIVMGLLKEEA